MIRVLLCGICLVVVQANARTLPSSADSPVLERPVAIDATMKLTNKIPEIIKQPDGRDSLARSMAATDPGAVLTAPPADFPFLQAISQEWVRPGDLALDDE